MWNMIAILSYIIVATLIRDYAPAWYTFSIGTLCGALLTTALVSIGLKNRPTSNE